MVIMWLLKILLFISLLFIPSGCVHNWTPPPTMLENASKVIEATPEMIVKCEPLGSITTVSASGGTDISTKPFETEELLISAKNDAYERNATHIVWGEIQDYWTNGFGSYRPAMVNAKIYNCNNKKVKYQEQVNQITQISNPYIEQSKVNFGQHWAIIIGLSQYQYAGQSGLAKLIFADDDAKAFYRSLINLGWFDSHIKLLINEEATQRNIMIALESWLTKAGSDDQIVLFWAGHGFHDPEDPEKVYFACYDTDLSIPATGYRMDKVRSALEERKSKNVILFADTCHAGKIITRGDSNRGISIVPNIRKQRTPKGWIFMVGADTDRQAIEHTSWSNGAFTHSLIKGLSGEADGFQSSGVKEGIVTMGELKAYMITSMPDETQKVIGVAKHPVITTSTGDPGIWNLTLQVQQ